MKNNTELHYVYMHSINKIIFIFTYNIQMCDTRRYVIILFLEDKDFNIINNNNKPVTEASELQTRPTQSKSQTKIRMKL